MQTNEVGSLEAIVFPLVLHRSIVARSFIFTCTCKQHTCTLRNGQVASIAPGELQLSYDGGDRVVVRWMTLGMGEVSWWLSKICKVIL